MKTNSQSYIERAVDSFIEEWTRDDGLLGIGKYDEDEVRESLIQKLNGLLDEVEKVISVKRVMCNPVPDSDEVVGYNEALSDVRSHIKKLRGENE